MKYDAVIVGAGFSGLYMLHRLRQQGLNARILECGDGIGGTWFWNRYPGVRCDVQSVEYAYSFSKELEEEWQWSELYPTQPEILKYLNHVADRFDLRKDIQLSTRVTSATYDEKTNLWNLQTNKGDSINTKFLIAATGCLSNLQVPKFDGLDTFEGKWYHTGNWPRESVDLKGKRVAVIGTGSSGVQTIATIASDTAHLYVFQRTPSFVVPAWNAPLQPEFVEKVKKDYALIHQGAVNSSFGFSTYFTPAPDKSALSVTPEERQACYESNWKKGGLGIAVSYMDLLLNKEANNTLADFIRAKIKGIVHDQAVAELLSPKDYSVCTKRLCVCTEYYDTFNRPNVTLVDARTNPIETITPKGVKTSAAQYDVDVIVFATGFDAVTGALANIDIRGKNGVSLKQKWAEGPKAYLGLQTAGFPNLFIVTGPGSPSVLSNMIVAIEQHVDWISNCIKYLNEKQVNTIEAAPEAENAWVDHANMVANFTLFPHTNSWYMGANIPGKPRVFLPYVGGIQNYRLKCDDVASKNYEGFVLST